MVMDALLRKSFGVLASTTSLHACKLKRTQYARKMLELGKYHARGMHTRENGSCSFHPSILVLVESAMKR